MDFKNVALGIILPCGEIIYINKIKGYQYHIEYLCELSFYNSYVHSILENIDLEFYKKNPDKVSLEIFPLFQKEGCFIYANLSPNTYLPTTWAIFYLSDSIILEQKNLMKSYKKNSKK